MQGVSPNLVLVQNWTALVTAWSVCRAGGSGGGGAMKWDAGAESQSSREDRGALSLDGEEHSD